MTRLQSAALAVVTASVVLAGGCTAAGNTPRPTPSSTPVRSPSTSPGPSGTATPSPTPTTSPTVPAPPVPSATPSTTRRSTGAQEPPWRTDTYAHKATSAATTARLTEVRTARHPEGRYDRIAFDFTSAMPGYQVMFATQVTRDGSGQVVSMPGAHAYLLIVFNPAAAHTDQGQPSLANPPVSPVTRSYPQLKSYVLNGDYEGYVSLALGLGDPTAYRTTYYKSGDHWTGYVDVRW